MRKLITSGAAAIAFGIASLAMSTMSQATITVVASYELGDSDPGAVSGNVGNATTVDSSGNGFNLTSRIGSPTYSSDRTPGSGYVSMSFDGSSFYSGPTVTNNTENFGISLFVKPTDHLSGSGIAINGSGCCSGFGIFLGDDGMYYGLYGGIDVVQIGAASLDTWVYLAVVNDGGVTRAYYNLVNTNNVLIGDPHPADGPVCCNPPLHMTIGSDGTHHFSGLIDDVQVFTFAPGAFNAADLIRVPEPASLALFGFGLAGLVASRRAIRKKKN